MTTDILSWVDKNGYLVAQLGLPDNGVRFTLTRHPTCYRRGQWRLLIEVCSGPNHHKWGCFDNQDQPLRNFHSLQNAFSEADLIAQVLWEDRFKGTKNEDDQHGTASGHLQCPAGMPGLPAGSNQEVRSD